MNSIVVQDSRSKLHTTRNDQRNFLVDLLPIQRFFKGQCTACKIYGHHIKDCRFVVPHIAMAKFVKQNPQIYNEILKNHIASNTVEH